MQAGAGENLPRQRSGNWLGWPAFGLLALALAGLVLLWWLALLQRPAIEADLEERAIEALRNTGESWVQVRFNGRDAVITGEALAEQPRVKVRTALENLFGVRQVSDSIVMLPERRPFTFTAVRDGRTLLVSGYVPSAYALARITEAARALPGGLSVQGIDRLVRARGAPAGDFSSVVAFALQQLVRLPAGRVTLSDDVMTIEGRSPDLATYDALAATFRDPLPQGFRVGTFAVRPPVAAPYMWSAVREGDQIRLLGYVPSEEARQQVLAAVRGALDDARVTDDMHLADGAPSTERWVKAISYALQQLAQLPKGRVLIADTSITLEGASPDYGSFDALMAARRTPPEGFTFARFLVEPPRVSPFLWAASLNGDTLKLTGVAPSEEASRGIVEAARSALPSVTVSDETKLASGGPSADAWVNAANFALGQLAKLHEGRVELSGTSITLSGEAADSSAYVTIRTAAQAPPPGIQVDVSALRPPLISPYVFAVRRDGEGVTVSGFFPDLATQAAIHTLLLNLYPDARINDVSGVGAGAPAGLSEVLPKIISQMARLETAELRIVDGQVQLSGAALHPAAVGEIVASVRKALPRGFVSEISLDRAPPGTPESDQECAREVEQILARRPLLFDGHSVRLAGQSGPALDRIVYAVQRCPATQVDVLGVPEGSGGGDFALSRARADTISTYLQQAGVAPGRLFVSTGTGGPAPGFDPVSGHVRGSVQVDIRSSGEAAPEPVLR
ncbi:flagellar motor protein MotB [Roseixanthobacter pseudopolyaromaticivorans]|uniref:flagellar motor protein MotB n=1 Tax=Xanthobacteraceae TaxID=335928 RepID=UPI003729079A